MDNGALFLPMSRLGIVKDLLSIDNEYEIADKKRNLEIVQIQAQAMMKDGDLDGQDLQTITLTIRHLLIPPQEMQPFWASAAGPHYNDWVNNIDKQEVTLEQAQKVSRYGMLLSLCQHFASVLSNAEKKFGNARYARNLFEKLLEIQSNRVAAMKNPNSTDISTLEAQDLVLYQP